MKSEPLEDAIKAAMKLVREWGVLKAIKKEGRDQQHIAKEEAKKAGMKLDQFMEHYPSEWNAYFEFSDDGVLENVLFDGTQYYRGHSGPVAQIEAHPSVTMDDIEEEIGETLFNAEIYPEVEQDIYEVVVGNIGSVISTGDVVKARKTFSEYIGISKSQSGRGSRESVTLLKNGEPVSEYHPLSEDRE